MAWRNVWRNRRRTLVTVSAMTLGLLTMILYAGLMEGYLRGMERMVLDIEVGDVQVFASRYRDDPSLDVRIEEPDRVLAPLAEAGFRASPRLLAWGLAASGDASAGVSLRGVDVVRDASVSRIHEQVARGRWLNDSDPHGVVIGRRLARALGVAPGAEVVLLSQGADGALAVDLYRVRGVLRGVGDAVDRTGVFLTEAAFRELLVVPAGVHQILVRRPVRLDLQAAVAAVQRVAPGLDVESWRQLVPTIASLLDSARAVMVVMFAIVYLAIGILILNAMLMAVFERIREFGVLKALGVGPLEVCGLIALESAIQTGLAVAAGVALAVPAILYLERVGIDLGQLAGVSVMGVAMDPIWRAAVLPSVFTGPIGVLLAIVAVAVVYPAAKAGWIQPVEAMRAP